MSTSKLQREVGNLLDKEFPQYTIRENHRPDWMISTQYTKLELDFYIEELRVAFEIQGQQHYQFVEFFHKTYDDFEKRKEYDKQKKDLCFGAKVKLFEIFTLTDAIVAIKDIQEKYNITTSRDKKQRHIYINNKTISNILKNKTQKTENKAILELNKWEKKVLVMGKMSSWNPINLPIEIVEKIQRGYITFEQARLILDSSAYR